MLQELVIISYKPTCIYSDIVYKNTTFKPTNLIPFVFSYALCKNSFYLLFLSECLE